MQVQDFLESHLNQLGREVASLQEGVQVKKIESKFLVSCIVAIKFCCFLPRVKFSASLTKTSGFSGAPLLGQKELADSCRQLLQVDQLVLKRPGFEEIWIYLLPDIIFTTN